MTLQDTARRAADEAERIVGCRTWLTILKLVLPFAATLTVGMVSYAAVTLHQLQTDVRVLATHLEERLVASRERNAKQDERLERLEERLLFRGGRDQP